MAPSPFTERIATYRVHVEKARIFLNPEPLLPGTFVESARIEGSTSAWVSRKETTVP